MKYQNQGGNDRISVDKFANKTFLNYKFDKLLFMLPVNLKYKFFKNYIFKNLHYFKLFIKTSKVTIRFYLLKNPTA